MGTACYWINDSATRVDVTTGTIFTGLFVADSDVYISGYYEIDYAYASYWKNGNRVDISTGFLSSEANSIFVDVSDVYVAGWCCTETELFVCYWKNDEKIDLMKTSLYATAYSIFVQ